MTQQWRWPAAIATLIIVVFSVTVITTRFPNQQLNMRTPSNAMEVPRRRVLIGPGSWPPRCNSKCGSCTPCKAVHVPIQPGVSVPLEYYPEAWRCKCGNKMYMP
ncbi:EPIDERMAL PATTERNING FACTOR-like protein 4 [Beta vulgaris subsp. vulgaris]|nr:EPIDERMAL PATTERNING FACTOR-like protein 4 [Beta vulgaris subsp. vulgaris]